MTQCDTVEQRRISDGTTKLLWDLAEANRLAGELNRLDPSQRHTLHSDLGHVLEQLWEDVKDDFFAAARRRYQKGGMPGSDDAVGNIALSLFSALLRKLPLRDAPEGNVRGWLLGVAHHRSIDDYHQDVGWRRLPRPGLVATLAEGDPRARMAPAALHGAPELAVYDQESHEIIETVDQNTLHWEAQVIEREFARTMTTQLQRRLQPELTPAKAYIVWCRTQDEPVPFSMIAQHLGPGFTAAAVRQAWHRICERARVLYQELDQQ